MLLETLNQKTTKGGSQYKQSLPPNGSGGKGNAHVVSKGRLIGLKKWDKRRKDMPSMEGSQVRAIKSMPGNDNGTPEERTQCHLSSYGRKKKAKNRGGQAQLKRRSPRQRYNEIWEV